MNLGVSRTHLVAKPHKLAVKPKHQRLRIWENFYRRHESAMRERRELIWALDIVCKFNAARRHD